MLIELKANRGLTGVIGMNYLKLLLGTAAGVALATTASAQTVGIGSTKAGAVAQITATIRAVSE